MASELVLFEPMDYNKKLRQYVKATVPGHKKVCYVTLNKTSLELIEFLRESKIDSATFSFIDGVTTKLFRAKSTQNCEFIDSLEDLGKFTDALLNMLKMNKIDLLIFDSLSSMMIYKQDYEIISFLDAIWPYLKKLGVDAKFIALSDDKMRPSIKQLSMMVDNSLVYSITK